METKNKSSINILRRLAIFALLALGLIGLLSVSVNDTNAWGGGQGEGLNGADFTLQNYFNFAGNLTPFFDELSGEVGRGMEIDTAVTDYIYGFDFTNNSIAMSWNTGENWDFLEPYVGKVGGLTQEEAAALPIADEYHITFSEPIGHLIPLADSTQALVPNVSIIDEYTLVVSIPGGTTIGDGVDAVIYLAEQQPLGPQLYGANFDLQNNFNFAGNLTPFFDALTGRINDDVEIDTTVINYIYGFDFNRNSIEMNWNTGPNWDRFEPYVGAIAGYSQEEAAALPMADEYHITFNKPIGRYIPVADSTQNLVPNVSIIDDYTLVISIPGGTTIGDGYDALIYLVPDR